MQRRIIMVGSLLATVFLASCGLLGGGSSTEGPEIAQDEHYANALAYYELTRDQETDLREIWNRLQDGKISEEERQTALRLLELEATIQAWGRELPDRKVPKADQQAIDAIIDGVFHNPASRGRMVLRSVERDQCRRITTHFYDGNRCFLDILLYDLGPTARAGLRLYLFKYEGAWKILLREDWIA